MNRKFILFIACVLLLVVVPARAQRYVSHTVQSGETLFKIASRYCMTWQEVYNINRGIIGENPDEIESGMILNVQDRCPPGIYDRGPRNGATGSIVGNVYTVASGDTLFSISQRFGMRVEAIAEANYLQDAGKISNGQRLLIPGLGQGTPRPPVVVPPAPPPLVSFNRGECTVNGRANAPIYEYPNGPVMGQVGPAGATFDVVRATRINGELWFELPGEMETPGGWIRNSDAPFNQDICQV